jgi:hypothetical protein
MNNLWNFIANKDEQRKIVGDIRHKERKIDELLNVCGSCDFWMTSQCQREKTKMVSNSMPICSDFKQQEWVAKFITKLQVEVVELKIVLNNLKAENY